MIIQTFKQYSKLWNKTAGYPNKGRNYSYPVIGLCGEVGEVAEKTKKIMRDKDGVFSPQDKVEICKELGDVLWYINAIAHELKIPFHKIPQINWDKLCSRKKRSVISGSGDNR